MIVTICTISIATISIYMISIITFLCSNFNAITTNRMTTSWIQLISWRTIYTNGLRNRTSSTIYIITRNNITNMSCCIDYVSSITVRTYWSTRTFITIWNSWRTFKTTTPRNIIAIHTSNARSLRRACGTRRNTGWCNHCVVVEIARHRLASSVI